MVGRGSPGFVGLYFWGGGGRGASRVAFEFSRKDWHSVSFVFRPPRSDFIPWTREFISSAGSAKRDFLCTSFVRVWSFWEVDWMVWEICWAWWWNFERVFRAEVEAEFGAVVGWEGGLGLLDP